jgi:UDP-glucose 4-epimerase
MLPAPISPYGLHKLIGEQYARLFHRLYGLEVVSLRYFNVFGPRQDPISQYAAAIPRFISRLLAGQPPIVFGDGRQTRDFTYVENVIEANLAAAAPAEAVADCFNIASGASTTVTELIATLNRVLGKNIAPVHDPPRPGDILHSVADISKAARVLNCPPRVDLATGLRRTIEWYRSGE